MIFTDRKITIRNGKSSINEPVVLYRGDYEVSIKFTIMESKFRFKSGVNLVDSEKASHGQLAILAPYGGNVFSEVVKCEDGAVTFTLTKEMIDQLEEVGLYSFQIRLFDYYRESRVSIPPVEFGIEVREPVASEDHDNEVNNAIVGYSIAKVVDGLNEKVPDTFDDNGQYNKTNWKTGDRITQGKLNKIEDALDKINQNEKNDVAALDKRVTNNFNVLNSTKLNVEDKIKSSQLDTSSNANKIQLNNLSDEVQKAMAGTANVNPVIADGSITNEKYADGSMSINKLATNLQKMVKCNYDSGWELGGYAGSNGEHTVNSVYVKLRELFHVYPGDEVRVTNNDYKAIIYHYDINTQTYINATSWVTNHTFAGEYYIHIAMQKNDSSSLADSDYDLIGSYLDLYFYTQKPLSGVNLVNNSITNDKYADGSISVNKLDTDFQKIAKLNYTGWELGGYSSTGAHSNSEKYVKLRELFRAYPGDKVKVTNDGYRALIYCYNVEDQKFSHYESWITNYTFTDDCYYHVAIQNTNGSSLADSDYDLIGSYLDLYFYTQKPFDTSLIKSGSINDTHIADNAVSYKHVTNGLKIGTVVTDGRFINFDTVNKVITIPAGSHLHYGDKYVKLPAAEISYSGNNRYACRIVYDPVAGNIAVKDSTIDITNDVLLGNLYDGGGSTNKVSFNCNVYTVNGYAQLNNRSINRSHTVMNTKAGYIISNGIIDVSFIDKKVIFKGDVTYVYYENYACPITQTEVPMLTNANQMLVFDTTTNTLKFVPMSLVESGSTQYHIAETYVNLGAIYYQRRQANINANNLVVNGLPFNGEYDITKNTLPDYLSNELHVVESSFNKIEGDLKFALCSDIHISNYRLDYYKCLLMNEIANHGHTDFTCIAGDIIDGFEQIDEDMQKITKTTQVLRHSSPNTFILQGNHDTGFQSFTDGNPSPETVVTPKNWFDMACRGLDVVFDKNNPYGGYYYKDYDLAKIRMIFLNTSDCYIERDGEFVPLGPMVCVMQPHQIDWLINEALNFRDKDDRTEWGVVVISHLAFNPNTVNVVAMTSMISSIFNAFVLGNKYVYSSKPQSHLADISYTIDCDFSDQGPMEFIASFNGHTHFDRVTNHPFGAPCIEIVNMVTNRKTESVPADAKTWGRVERDISAVALDFISIDRATKTITCKRLGAGEDRTIKY